MPLPSDGSTPPADVQADAALSYIEGQLPGIDTISAMLNQRYKDDGTLYDVMDIGWRIKPNLVNAFADYVPDAEAVRQSLAVTTTTYYSHPDAMKDWPNIALGEIILKASKVLSIFAGLPQRENIPPEYY